MPIRFRCPQCHRPLSIGSRKAGKPITCPVCKAGVTVPETSNYFKRSPLEIDDNVAGSLALEPTALPEVEPAGEPSGPRLLPPPPAAPPALAAEPAEPALAPDGGPPPADFSEAPMPVRPGILVSTSRTVLARPEPPPAGQAAAAAEVPESSWRDLLPGAALVGTLLLLLVVPALLYVLSRVAGPPPAGPPAGPAVAAPNEGPAGPRPPATTTTAQRPLPDGPAHPEKLIRPPDAGRPAQAPRGAHKKHRPQPQQARQIDPPAEAPEQVAPRPEPSPPPAAEPAPVKAEAPPPPLPPAAEVKQPAPDAVSWEEKWRRARRSRAGDEELRKDLLAVPEVALDAVPGSTARLLAAARSGAAGTHDLAPLLMAQRYDLAGLRPRMGRECRLGKEPAEDLQALSRKLRVHLEAAIPGAGSGTLADPRPDPDKLRQRLLGDGERGAWLQAEAIPTLLQLLMAENKNVRLVLVDLLKQIPGRRATEALAARALYDLHPQVREAAVAALKDRPASDYEPVLVAGFQYPWRPVADHAAEALVVLGDKGAVPNLVMLLQDKDVSRPFTMPAGNKRTVTVVRELVRVNHLGNCLLCHAPSFQRTDLVRGRVPIPGQPLPAPVTTPQYYEGNQGVFVRADTTYLRQDFSVCQPVDNPGTWPAYQRYDYLVRLRPVTGPELTAWRKTLKDRPALSPRQEALLFALRELTGKDLGPLPESWRQLLAIARPEQPGGEAADPADLERGTAPAAAPDLRAGTRRAFAQYLAELPLAELRAKLKDGDADLRHAAVLACGLRKASSLAPDLTERLRDADPGVAAAAGRVLRELDPDLPRKVEGQNLAGTLADSAADRQLELVEAYRVGEGHAYDLALARAIPNLPAVPRIKAREALAERLTKAPVAEVREALRDAERELRLAALEASAQKKVFALVPDLIPLLNDADPQLIRRARLTLRQLTGRDVGPEAGAAIDERLRVLRDWQAWWKAQGRR